MSTRPAARALAIALYSLAWPAIVACSGSDGAEPEELASQSADLSADTGVDVRDASVDVHDAGADVHDASLDVHDAGADVHDASADVHDASADVLDVGADAHDAAVDAHDAAVDAHDAAVDAHDAAVDASCGNCDDENGCTTDSCVNGTCTHTDVANGTVCSDGNACTTNDTCTTGKCGGLAVVCTASDQCHQAGTCNTSTGVCSNPTVNQDTPCNDGNPCTFGDICVSGVCAGVVITCSASDPCHEPGTCNPSTGVCSNPAAGSGTACDDGNACTTGDVCTAGVCGGAAVTCSASDPCHEPGTCNPSTGVCSNPTAGDGTVCNDGNACTSGDLCTGGACAGVAVRCAAADACHTAGTCNPANGTCSSPPAASGMACGSTNKCVGALLCDGSGNCVQQPAPVIDTSNPCVLGSCNPDAGVVYTPVPGCGPTTDQWQPVVGRPSPRDGAASVYLPMQNALLVFGGANAGAPMADTWTWNRATNLWSGSYAAAPTPRAAAAVAYDSARQRVVLFGGLSHGAAGDTYLGDTWEYDPVAQAWQSASPAASPAARAYAAVGFDSARGKTVLFGGRAATGAADAGSLWEWDGATWTQRTAANAPPGRATSAMVYDSARARFVLFGGETASATAASVALGDTLELDPVAAAWTSVATPTAPPPRMGHAMYYDATRSKTVLFGGTSRAQADFGDTWEYDGAGATWTPRTTPASPPARAGHVLAFDAATGHGLLVGGVGYSSTSAHTPNLDDVWEYDPVASSWSLRSVDAAPALYYPGLAFDASRSTFVLRGNEAQPAMWELANGRWTAKGALAGQNADFGASFAFTRLGLCPTCTVYDSVRQRTLLVTEGTEASFSTDPMPPQIWEWDGATWTLRACNGGPDGLVEAGIAYDTNRGVLVVVGGIVNDGFSAPFGTWEVDSATCTWANRSGATPAPPSRSFPNLAWDASRNVVVLFSGGNGQADTWEWDGVAGTWTARATAASPPARIRAGTAFDPNRARVVLFGGSSASSQTPLGDVWEYDGAAGAWTNPVPAAAPGPRYDASLGFDPASGRVLLFGGESPLAATERSTLYTDLWSWDGTSFTRRLLGASPGPRSGASGGFVPARGIGALFGGERGDGERSFLQDTWIWQGGEWSSPSAAFADNAPSVTVTLQSPVTELTPPARAGHAFALGMETSPQMLGWGLLFGGQGDEGLLGDTWLWDDQLYVWTASGGISPAARAGHAIAAIPGTGFLLFGGSGAGGALLNDSWVFSAVNVVGGWAPLSVSPPPARTEHAMAFDAVTQKVVLFGGRSASGALQDTWEYDPDARAWTQRTPSFSPPARFGHAMFYDTSRGTVVMIGGTGNDPSTTLADAYEWDSNAGSWTDLPSASVLAPRAGAVGFFDATRGQSVVSGGLAYGQGGAEVATYGDTVAFSRASELGIRGVACTSASTCASGFCVDGNCCNSACTGQCAACNVPGSGGTCTAVLGNPYPGRPACPLGNSNVCSPPQCDGANMNACAVPATPCGPPTCADPGSATGPQMCDPTGACGAPTTKISCAPASCSGAGQCGSPNGCAGQTGYCAPGAFCSLSFNGASYPPGVCEMPAKLASFTASPTSPGTSVPIALTATTSVGTNPIFTFTYTPPGGKAMACSTASPTPSCTFVPSTAGSYTVSVSVVAIDEQASVPDDSQSFSITVAQNPPPGPPVDWGNSQPFTGQVTLLPNTLQGIQVNVSQAGVLTALGLFPGNELGTGVQMALYTDAAGVPSSLVASTAVVGIGPAPIPVTTPVWLEAGNYWVMADCGFFVNVSASTTSTTTTYFVESPFGSVLPAFDGQGSPETIATLNYYAVTESP
jgi:hypothetical protein